MMGKIKLLFVLLVAGVLASGFGIPEHNKYIDQGLGLAQKANCSSVVQDPKMKAIEITPTQTKCDDEKNTLSKSISEKIGEIVMQSLGKVIAFFLGLF